MSPALWGGARSLGVQAPPSTATAATPGETSSTDGRQKAFHASAQGRSGELLLVEAYALLWLVIFGMLLLSWRKQRRLEDRVEQLAAELEKTRNKDELDG